MKEKWRKCMAICVIGIGAALPQQAKGVGQILVYAFDTSKLGEPPPSITVSIDGESASSFGTNTHLLFSDLSAGTHTVEVVTTASGYLPVQSPNAPDQVGNPNSGYGNPRHVVVSNGALTSCSFSFAPMISASATVRDEWTMDRIGSATIEFIFEGSTGDVVVCKYPETATYASNWQSGVDGTLPTNTLLHHDDYDLRVSRTGYNTLYVTNAITNAQAGDSIDLTELFLQPIDVNTNLISDAWETACFGAGSNVVCDADADGDGVCNRDEYVSGTDPTNDSCVLTFDLSLNGDDLELTWNTESWRTYRVIGCTELCTGEWVQVGGSWEATNGQTEMTWVETNLDLSWNSNYRVEVVPCTWTGTNQVLVKTNRPDFGGIGGSTNGPPLP